MTLCAAMVGTRQSENGPAWQDMTCSVLAWAGMACHAMLIEGLTQRSQPCTLSNSHAETPCNFMTCRLITWTAGGISLSIPRTTRCRKCR